MSMIGLWLSKDGKTFRIWNRHDPLRGDSGSGGGVSAVFPVQEWEVGRQVLSLNDGQRRHWVGGLAGPADQGTGLLISYRNRVFWVGGTSADGPIYAGMTARLNAALGKRGGFYLPYVIKTIADENSSKLVTPVTEGNNIPTNGKGYQAQDLKPGMLNFGELKTRLEAQLKKNKRAA